MVEVDETKQTKSLKYDQSSVQGETIHITCTNPNDLSDVSNPPDSLNDGYFNVTFPLDYSGECLITVEGSDGGEDSGTIVI
jgi:hypothetical protein